MSTKVPIPFTTGFYESESLPISAQRCVNWYPNMPQADTVTTGNLFGTPGLIQLTTVSDIDVTRGEHVMASLAYFVIGTSLYRLDRTIVLGVDVFGTTSLGTIESTGRVWMADNGTQLCIVVPGGKAYIFTEGPATLTEITDVNFDGPASTVVYIDGFFFFTKSTGKKYFHSNLNDGLTYNALDFGVAESDPDQIRASHVLNSQVFVIGSETVETFRNIGRDPNSFKRIQGAIFPKGIFAPFSVISTQHSFAFIGGAVNESPAIWRYTGNGFEKISTTAIESALQKFTDSEIEDAFSWTYAETGAFFIGFAIGDTCFQYNEITGKWSELESDGGKYRVAGMVTAYGRVLVGDQIDGRIGELSRTTRSEYGNDIQRIIITKPFDNIGDAVFVSEIEAVIPAGVGTSTLDPQIRLSWSDDGGRTFSNELSRGMGLVGEYNRRAIWNRLGRFPRSRVLKFEMSEQVDPTLIKIEATVA